MLQPRMQVLRAGRAGSAFKSQSLNQTLLVTPRSIREHQFSLYHSYWAKVLLTSGPSRYVIWTRRPGHDSLLLYCSQQAQEAANATLATAYPPMILSQWSFSLFPLISLPDAPSLPYSLCFSPPPTSGFLRTRPNPSRVLPALMSRRL